MILVESGGLHRQPLANALSEVENIGSPRFEDQSLRPRILGRTSDIWTGRCAPFDEIDYEPRNWVPYSGWPFDSGELLP